MTSMGKSGAARAIADLTQGTILATVQIAATRERVFRALTSPEEVVRWWGSPDTYQTTGWDADVRQGGGFRATGVGADGQPFAVEGEYLVVDPPNKLVHTWKAEWDGGALTTVTIVLDSVEGGTRVTLRHEGFAGRAESCASHAAGWEMVLGWLDAHSVDAQAQTHAAADVSYYMCQLSAPRPSFPGDMTEAEGRAMQEHFAYWNALLAQGTAVVFGAVFDPKGAWGAAIVGVRSEDEVGKVTAEDPLVRAELGFHYQVHPMPNAVVRPL